MTDPTKLNLSPSEAKYIPLSTAKPIASANEARAEMYKKLELDDKHIEFLEADYNSKFLQYFEVGNEKLPMYGGIARMAQESKLIKTLVNLDPPYTLASNMTVYGGALILLWLNLNGFHDSAYKIKTLSLPGFLNL